MGVFTGTKPDIERVYLLYADMLYRLALTYLSRADAEDAVQDVFVKYINSSPEFADADRERAWFIRVTANRCRDIIRRNRLRLHASLDEVEGESVTSGADDVTAALKALPDKYKRAVVLHYLEGYTVEKTAELLGIGESAVKMRLARARQMLKTELKED